MAKDFNGIDRVVYQNTTFIRFQKLLFWQNNRIYDSFSIGTLAGA